MSEQLLKEILGELKTLNQRTGNLEEGQKVLTGRLDKLEEGQRVLTGRFDKLEEGQKELAGRVGRIEEGLLKLETRLENEVVGKIGALFDGFSLRGNQIENLKNHLDGRLDEISLDINYLVSRSARHERAINELKLAK